MDDLDFQIIKKLQENAKLSYNQIAKMLKTPTSTIHFRVQKMIEEKLIVKFTSIVDVGKLGYETVGWVGLTIDPLKTDEIANKIASFDEVRITTGRRFVRSSLRIRFKTSRPSIFGNFKSSKTT